MSDKCKTCDGKGYYVIRWGLFNQHASNTYCRDCESEKHEMRRREAAERALEAAYEANRRREEY